MDLTVANILTLARLVLTPIFVFCFVIGKWPVALTIFIVAAFTDLVDGTVARLLKQHSKGGALLDPIADKFLVQSCFVCLLTAGILPWWFFSVAFARDLTIIAGIIYLERIQAKLPYKPLWTSKFATLFQLLLAGFGLILWRYRDATWLGIEVEKFYFVAILIAFVLIIISGTQYIRVGIGILRAREC